MQRILALVHFASPFDGGGAGSASRDGTVMSTLVPFVCGSG
jgi:hypothetical protein